jgi:hypothetical protein
LNTWHELDVRDLGAAVDLLHGESHAPRSRRLVRSTCDRGLDVYRDEHLGLVALLGFDARLCDGSLRLCLRLLKHRNEFLRPLLNLVIGRPGGRIEDPFHVSTCLGGTDGGQV